MGDGINKITNIKKVRNRGVIEEKTGEYVGGGTKVFDEIKDSGLKAVVIPGLHRGIGVLDRRFKALYSHCASAEKVSLSYHSFLEVNKEIDAENIIISDISSNTVTIGIKSKRFFGAIDACLGAIGIFHGPLDLETIRAVDEGKTTANEAFYSSGASKITGAKIEDILNPKNEKVKLALDSLILSAKMEIFSFLSEIKPDAIVITGFAGVHDNVFYPLKDTLEKIAPVFKIDGYCAAIGSAEIARDILASKRDFLGIPVDL
jgi:putative methanogenesis marker protein 12